MSDRLDAQYRLALAHHAAAAFDDAEPLCREILRIDPRHAGALHLLGQMAHVRGDHDSALALIGRSIDIEPHDGQAHRSLGEVYQALERGHDAQASFWRAQTIETRTGEDTRLARKLSDVPEGGWQVDPDSLDTLVRYADSLRESEKLPEAIAAYEQARQFGAESPHVDYALAALGALPRPPHMPQDVVRSHFDDFAEVFDSHLVDTLHYRAPQYLSEALEGVLPDRPVDVLDLGCGTGLCAPLLRPAARRLVGVDLSERMLERAAEQGRYDELVCAEATQALRAAPDSQDVVVAADVLMYFGELDELFAATHCALRPGGVFAFSAEAGVEAEIELRPNLRFAHSGGYLRKLARRHRFSVQSMAQAAIRQERQADVQAHIVVLRAG